ncbi:MAG: MAPEG family protein [Pseudomonadota bacterium]
MNTPEILYPMFALAGWTNIVLLLVPIARVRAALRREVTTKDFKFGESARVPSWVSIPNRNYMNLLELPMLFYVVCLTLYVMATVSISAIYLAWAFVALRIIHSVIHLSYNKVLHRLIAFAASNLVLLTLWILAAVNLHS